MCVFSGHYAPNPGFEWGGHHDLLTTVLAVRLGARFEWVVAVIRDLQLKRPSVGGLLTQFAIKRTPRRLDSDREGADPIVKTAVLGRLACARGVTGWHRFVVSESHEKVRAVP